MVRDALRALFERGWLAPNADLARCDVATTPALCAGYATIASCQTSTRAYEMARTKARSHEGAGVALLRKSSPALASCLPCAPFRTSEARYYGIAVLRDFELVAANAATQSHLIPSQMIFRRKRRGRAHCARRGAGAGAPQTNQPNFQTSKLCERSEQSFGIM